MKRVVLIVSLLILSLVAIQVTALSPSLEQECCAYLEGDEKSFNGYIGMGCLKLFLTERKCEDISQGWKSAQDEFERSTKPEYACCVYLGRDDEALEIFDEEFVYKTCPSFNLDSEKCFEIRYGYDDYDSEDDYEGFDEYYKRIQDLIIIALLAFVAFVIWLLWKGIRKIKR